MKKMISACAIVLVCLNLANCTPEGIVENSTEQLTDGEEGKVEIDPDA